MATFKLRGRLQINRPALTFHDYKRAGANLEFAGNNHKTLSL